MKLILSLVLTVGVASVAHASAKAAVPKTATKSAASEADRDAMVEALWKANYAAAKKLHKKGVSYDVLATTDDMTGLMRAADDGIEEVVQEILALGASVNAKNPNGESALWYATYSGHEKLALWLIAHGASAEGQRPDSKECLLHMSVQADMMELSKKLMKITPKCASTKDVDGHTPAAVAKSLGYDKLAKLVSPVAPAKKKK